MCLRKQFGIEMLQLFLLTLQLLFRTLERESLLFQVFIRAAKLLLLALQLFGLTLKLFGKSLRLTKQFFNS
ncbi:hypothetical protein D3C81_2170000 [compost metagenome]